MTDQTCSQIVDFSASVAAENSEPAADRLISGQPRQTIANFFSDPTQQFHSRDAGRARPESGASDIRNRNSAV